jgi:hypothetical protein
MLPPKPSRLQLWTRPDDQQFQAPASEQPSSKQEFGAASQTSRCSFDKSASNYHLGELLIGNLSASSRKDSQFKLAITKPAIEDFDLAHLRFAQVCKSAKLMKYLFLHI